MIFANSSLDASVSPSVLSAAAALEKFEKELGEIGVMLKSDGTLQLDETKLMDASVSPSVLSAAAALELAGFLSSVLVLSFVVPVVVFEPPPAN